VLRESDASRRVVAWRLLVLSREGSEGPTADATEIGDAIREIVENYEARLAAHIETLASVWEETREQLAHAAAPPNAVL
jgi:hypothetical protein